MHRPVFGLIAAGLLLSAAVHSQTAFTDISESAGIHYRHDGFPYGGGIAPADFDGDGWVDIYLTTGAGYPNQLYMNNGDGTFRETAVAAGVANTSEGMAAVCGDVDNDGRIDLFLANHDGPNRLYRNAGDGTFEDVTMVADVWDQGPATGAAMADVDNDGWLDIYVLNHSQNLGTYLNRLYINRGDGTFREEGAAMNAADGRTGLAVGFFDFNGDRFPDFYLVNEYDTDGLFLNNGDGTFRDIGAELGLLPGGGMGVDFSDFDRDGDIDIYVANLYRDYLYRNDGDGGIDEVSAALGIENLTMGWGVNFLDYDNDGDEDLYVVNGAMIWPERYPEENVFYRNNGNGFFVEAAASLGLADDGDARASASADIDNDGFVDLMVINIDRGRFRLFRNHGNGNRWVSVNLVGSRSNRCGIGARIEVRAGNTVQVREVAAGGSYGAMHSLVTHFGLRSAERIDRLTVLWPSGQETELTHVPTNRELTITEPGDAPATAVPSTIEVMPNYPNPFNPDTRIPFRLTAPARLTLEVYDTAARRVIDRSMGTFAAGDGELLWNGGDRTGRPLPTGVYLYRLRLEDGPNSAARKMILLR